MRVLGANQGDLALQSSEPDGALQNMRADHIARRAGQLR